jgi:chromosome segregation ATPase
MSKENSHGHSKISIKSSGITLSPTNKVHKPLNVDVSSQHTSKTKKIKSVNKRPAKKLKYVDAVETLKSETALKSKFFSLEKIIDFMKYKNNELMKEIQEQFIKTIAVEEHKSHLALQNKNIEDLYAKAMEEKNHTDEENSSLRAEIELNKNRIRGLMQEVNHLHHEVEHLRTAKQRLMNTIRDQESVISNEKKTKQQLETTVVGLNHAISEHVKSSNYHKLAAKTVPMPSIISKFDKHPNKKQ